MGQYELLSKLEGLHTVETVATMLDISRQSALNLLCRLKKEQHVTVRGGGRRKRLYKITMRKQRPRSPGMFDIINTYSPHMKLNPWYDHQVHGIYGPEEALIDAIQTESFRVILASLRLFNHITDWPKLYRLAQKKGYWQKVGAMYDVARLFMKVRRMPGRYYQSVDKKIQCLIKKYTTKEKLFIPLKKKWNVEIPFRKGDIAKVAMGLT